MCGVSIVTSGQEAQNADAYHTINRRTTSQNIVSFYLVPGTYQQAMGLLIGIRY